MSVNYKKYSTAGISLIEAIIAFALLSIVIVVIFSFLLFSQNTFRSTSFQTELTQNGRFAIDRVTRDIRIGTKVKSLFPSSIQIEDRSQQDINTLDDPTIYNARYIIYSLDSLKHELTRTIKVCYKQLPFDTVTNWEKMNDNGTCPNNEPQVLLGEDNIPVAEFVEAVTFNGDNPVAIELTLKKNNKSVTLKSEAYPRNK